MFSGHKYYKSGDVGFENAMCPYVGLIINRSCGFRLGDPAKFDVDRHCVSVDIMGLICHMISQGDIIKG